MRTCINFFYVITSKEKVDDTEIETYLFNLIFNLFDKHLKRYLCEMKISNTIM